MKSAHDTHALAGNYRPEVDGLRAIAVLSVILFHADFALFSGGFVGVDIFFVISGFLITGILLEELRQGEFSFAAFYARRARRILPALTVVLLVCAPAVWLLMPRNQVVDFFQAMAATAVFVANVFHGQHTGYFDTRIEQNPLLHTWSLSVEEQYYLLLPLLLLVLWRRPAQTRQRTLLATLALLCVASLAVGEQGARYDQNANFFASASRAWELLCGSFAAAACHAGVSTRVAPQTASGRPAHRGLAALGLLGIVCAIGMYDRYTPSPSVWLLLPTLGAALVLVFGDARSGVGRLLAWPGLVWLGLISYSAYLWHQPLLALARAYSPMPLSTSARLGLVFATLCLAYLSWRWVERPFRAMVSVAPQRTLMAALAASLSLVALGLGGASVVNSLGSSEPPSVAMAFLPPPRTQECLDISMAHDPTVKPDGWFCTLNPGSAQAPSFFVLGDSHGLQLVAAFDKAAASAHRTGQFAGFSGCIPLLGLYPLTRPNQARYDCHALNARVLAHIKSQGIKELFLVAKWSYYTDFWNGTPYLNAVGLAPTDDISQAQSRKAFQAGLLDTVAAYQQLGVRLHVIEQVPQQ